MERIRTKRPRNSLTKAEAAQRINVTVRSVENYVARGLLGTVDVFGPGLSRRVFIMRSEVERFLRERRARRVVEGGVE